MNTFYHGVSNKQCFTSDNQKYPLHANSLPKFAKRNEEKSFKSKRLVNDRQTTIYKLIQLQYYYKQKLKNSKKHSQTSYDVQDKWQIEDEVKRRIDGLNSKRQNR